MIFYSGALIRKEFVDEMVAAPCTCLACLAHAPLLLKGFSELGEIYSFETLPNGTEFRMRDYDPESNKLFVKRAFNGLRVGGKDGDGVDRFVSIFVHGGRRFGFSYNLSETIKHMKKKFGIPKKIADAIPTDHLRAVLDSFLETADIQQWSNDLSKIIISYCQKPWLL